MRHKKSRRRYRRNAGSGSSGRTWSPSKKAWVKRKPFGKGKRAVLWAYRQLDKVMEKLSDGLGYIGDKFPDWEDAYDKRAHRSSKRKSSRK